MENSHNSSQPSLSSPSSSSEIRRGICFFAADIADSKAVFALEPAFAPPCPSRGFWVPGSAFLVTARDFLTPAPVPDKDALLVDLFFFFPTDFDVSFSIFVSFKLDPLGSFWLPISSPSRSGLVVVDCWLHCECKDLLALFTGLI